MPVAGDAGRSIDDGQPLADQPIEQARFANIWPADDHNLRNTHRFAQTNVVVEEEGVRNAISFPGIRRRESSPKLVPDAFSLREMLIFIIVDRPMRRQVPATG